VILSEPPPSQGDVHFRLGPFPVRIHPFFWLVAFVTGLSATGGEPKAVLMWMVVVLVSIVVHELGHALLQRLHGGTPRIVLHGLGGLAISDRSHHSALANVLVSLAGPAAGFVLAVLILGIAPLAGVELQFRAPWDNAEFTLPSYYPAELFLATVAIGGQSQPLALLVALLLQVNVLWGLINLLPIYPLDGGQVSRELMMVAFTPRTGIIRSLWLSIGCAVAAAVLLGLARQSVFSMILFGVLAYSSYQALQAYRDEGYYSNWR
jgi:stage IV sporulation protein FB